MCGVCERKVKDLFAAGGEPFDAAWTCEACGSEFRAARMVERSPREPPWHVVAVTLIIVVFWLVLAFAK